MSKLIYNYDELGFYVGSSRARLDPRASKVKGKDVYLIPRNATAIPVPSERLANGDGYWFDVQAGKWVVKNLPQREVPEDEFIEEDGT